MIPVSNEFKKAIKDRERRIKGYVEVLYDLPDLEPITQVFNMTSIYTNPSEISNGIRVENDYGTVDYLPLDGSKLVMGDTNINSGFISDEVVYEITNPRIVLSFPSTSINGMTFYFRDNYPTTINLTFSDGTTMTIQDVGEYVQQVVFDEPKTITSVTAEFDNWTYNNRKIKIMEIDLGITQTYKDQDLLEFTVDEEVNKLVEETPTNEVDITLNNMQDLFNPLNPQGIVRFLTENVKIIPYIGVLTENNGVEYVKMGEFYFDSYTNNSDATTTLVGKNIIKQIENDEITDGLVGLTSAFVDMPSDTSPNLTQDIINRLGYNVDFSPRQKIAYYFKFLNDINLMNYFKDLTIHDYSIFYANRNNRLIIRNPQSEIVDALTKNELIEDIKYKKIEKINTLIKNDTRASSTTESIQGTNTTIFAALNAQFVLKETTQNFAIKNDVTVNAWAFQDYINFTYTGATSASIVYGSNTYTIVQATGNVGDTVSFNCVYLNHTVTANNIGQNYEITNRGINDKKISLGINSVYNAFPERVRTDLGLLEYAPSYEMSFEYNGDPSLEAGDYINVETPYGYKPLFIQKNRFTFNGGLQGSIEGVE